MVAVFIEKFDPAAKAKKGEREISDLFEVQIIGPTGRTRSQEVPAHIWQVIYYTTNHILSQPVFRVLYRA